MIPTMLDEIVRMFQEYFDKHEADFYSTAINPLTKSTYQHDARRQFVNHYLKGSRIHYFKRIQ